MPAANTSKKPAAGAAPKKAGAGATPRKRAAKDPYDDPRATSPKSRKSPGSSSAKKSRKPKVQDNPLGMMAEQRDPYDDPWAPAPRAEKTRADKKPRSTDAARSKSPSRAGSRRPRAARDPFDEPAQRSSAPGKHSRSSSSGSDRSASGRHRKNGSSGGGRSGYLTFLLTLLTMICLMLVVLQLYNYSNFRKMRDAVDVENFFAGTVIDGVDISGMTVEDAIDHWAENIEPEYYNRTVTLEDGAVLTSLQLGYTSDYDKVITDAWKSQTTGALKDRYAAQQRFAASGNGYTVTRSAYSDAAVDSAVAEIAARTDTQLKEPGISGFDYDTFSFTFSEGVQGRTLDRAKLSNDIKSALDNGGGQVTYTIHTQDPTVSTADMGDKYGLIAYAVTNASSSSSNRLSNIKLSLSAINGTLLKPGEEFSFNDVVGKRSAERGYKTATAYSGGEVTEELGGGICQVSTTLFNAAVKSGLRITERYNHSIPVSYVDKGKDATVNWGAQDLKFVNDTDEPVYIVAYLDDTKRVRVGVFGRLPEDGSYITVEAEITYSKEYETEYQYNAFLLPGDQEVVQTGRNAYEAMAYKCTWSADGELISRESLCKSTYHGRKEIIQYGP